ncbi:ATP-binding protein [Gilvimarinus chinensis]|uniref:ATP-binding protein n=1 Tax=Gilvimarinus chinensis TaxID=396005 RepID=UPI00037F224E|nr:ATP-binding protein [Gilvimarinus chinensis]
MRIRDFLTGFAGRLFLWFWLSLTLVLVANFFLGRYLEERIEPRPLLEREKDQFTKLQHLLDKRDYTSIDRLRRSRAGKDLILLDPNDKKPFPDRRLYWRLRPLLEAPNLSAMEIRPGLVALGPFDISTAEGSVTAIWLMPPRAVPPWKQILHDSPHWRLLTSSILVLALSLILARWLSRPVRQLSRAARRLGDGDLSVRVAPIKGELGELGQEFNDMAEKLNMAMTNQQRLLADVSHELRSPLTRLKLAAGLLADQQENSYTSRIEKECDTLEHLIEQVLTLARLEGSAYQEDFSPANLSELVQSAVEDWRFQMPDKKLNYQGPDQLSCRAKPRLIQRILDNLLANATRYAEAVQLTLTGDAHHWQLTVEDNGPGVPEEQLGKLFEPFFRGDSARPHGGNIGLGLAIVQAAAQAQRLHIRVEHSTLGGLKFTLHN